MPTLLRCINCRVGNSVCVFSKVLVCDVAGYKRQEVPERNCLIGKEDEYRMYPRSARRRTDGLLVWHEHEVVNRSDPMPIANRPYQFEALTNHWITGDEYDLRRHEYDHPLYHMIEFNVPSNRYGDLADTEVCELLGTTEPVLMSNRWFDDGFGQPYRAIGKERVAYCTGLYGTFDMRKKLAFHKSMRDHWPDVSWWVNYTQIHGKAMGKKPLNIFESEWEKIEEYCAKHIPRKKLLGRILEALAYVKHGEYINLYVLMRNNGATPQQIRTITRGISTKNPETIHVSSTGKGFSLEKLWNLYEALRTGKIGHTLRERQECMANIVNFVLNDPRLQKINPHQPGGFRAAEKYWFMIKILNRAIYDDRIVIIDKIPEWLRTMVKKHVSRDPSIKLCGNTVVRMSQLHDEFKEEFSDYAQSVACGLSEPADLYPRMRTVRDICEVDTREEKYFKEFMEKILPNVTRISPLEMRDLWVHWESTRRRNVPTQFWKYIHGLTDGGLIDDLTPPTASGGSGMYADEILGVCTDYDSFEVLSPEESKYSRKASPLIWEEAQKAIPLNAMLEETESEYGYDSDGEVNYEQILMSETVDQSQMYGSGYHVVSERIDDEFDHLTPIDEIERDKDGGRTV